ncbi:MAG: hypothetical protein WAJ91_08570, partial [Rhodoplanes sp.]
MSDPLDSDEPPASQDNVPRPAEAELPTFAASLIAEASRGTHEAQPLAEPPVPAEPLPQAELAVPAEMALPTEALVTEEPPAA